MTESWAAIAAAITRSLTVADTGDVTDELLELLDENSEEVV